MTEHMKPILFALADAMEIDLYVEDYAFTGSRKAVLELFEGYSPTIVSNIENSLYSQSSKIVAAQVHVFGNVGVIAVVEEQKHHVSLFVYDRSKAPKGEPWDYGWSRRVLYKWLGPCCKAVYHRSMFDKDWHRLEKGLAKLRTYNKQRENKEVSSREADACMWGDI